MQHFIKDNLPMDSYYAVQNEQKSKFNYCVLLLLNVDLFFKNRLLCLYVI